MKMGDLLIDEKTDYSVLLVERKAYCGTWYWYAVSSMDGSGTWASHETLKRVFSLIYSSARSEKK